MESGDGSGENLPVTMVAASISNSTQLAVVSQGFGHGEQPRFGFQARNFRIVITRDAVAVAQNRVGIAVVTAAAKGLSFQAVASLELSAESVIVLPLVFSAWSLIHSTADRMVSAWHFSGTHQQARTRSPVFACSASR
jgi:hypothetical protein